MVRSQGVRVPPVSEPLGTTSLTIGELAAAGGVGVETIRFYQRRDLLRTPARGGGIRHYGRDDVRRLRFIRQAQAAGFTLEEIRELLELDAGEDRGRARELAKVRIEALPDEEERKLFCQSLFNRLMFLYFLQRKGWLTFKGDADYLAAL